MKAKHKVTGDVFDVIQWTGENKQEVNDFCGGEEFLASILTDKEPGVWEVREKNYELILSDEDFVENYDIV